jgi:hypothetical protein
MAKIIRRFPGGLNKVATQPGPVARQDAIAVSAHDVGHLKGWLRHRLWRRARAAHHVDAGDRHRVQRIRDRLEMPLREVQVD